MTKGPYHPSHERNYSILKQSTTRYIMQDLKQKVQPPRCLQSQENCTWSAKADWTLWLRSSHFSCTVEIFGPASYTTPNWPIPSMPHIHILQTFSKLHSNLLLQSSTSYKCWETTPCLWEINHVQGFRDPDQYISEQEKEDRKALKNRESSCTTATVMHVQWPSILICMAVTSYHNMHCDFISSLQWL
jgi:hypothetical protein